MPSNPTYNPRVYYIEDEDERDQCQFIYTPQNGEGPRRCQRDGIYRIGLTIFLCGIHMPGDLPSKSGRHPRIKPVTPSKPRTLTVSAIETRLLEFFSANAGQVISYKDIQEKFPNLDSRQYIFIAVAKLRKAKKANILNVPHVGYTYVGRAE